MSVEITDNKIFIGGDGELEIGVSSDKSFLYIEGNESRCFGMRGYYPLNIHQLAQLIAALQAMHDKMKDV